MWREGDGVVDAIGWSLSQVVALLRVDNKPCTPQPIIVGNEGGEGRGEGQLPAWTHSARMQSVFRQSHQVVQDNRQQAGTRAETGRKPPQAGGRPAPAAV
jgi:hypothetical protein